MNDVTFRILLTMSIVKNFTGMVVDIETAFLHGELKEEIFMDLPEGLKYMEGNKEVNEGMHCVELKKSIYGLVQAAREWWKKLKKTLETIGFKGGNVDPCVFHYRGPEGTVFVGLYVDDCLCIGDRNAIDFTVQGLKEQGLKVKVENDLSDYLNCEIHFSEGKSKAWLGQSGLMKKIEEKFGSLVKGMKNYATPGTPHFGITRQFDKEQELNKDQQKIYRSAVGSLLYLVKHSRPDIANAVRELSKTMDQASLAGWKEMKRVIKYVLDSREKGLKIEPEIKDQWELEMYSDSDFAGDKDKRISVTGYILYLSNVPIAWKSKSQKSVTLSSSEAEFVAMSEAVKEIRFVYQLLKSIGMKVKIPVKMRIDNVGAIFMAENVTTSNRTKHIDTRFNYVREYIQDEFLEIKFVRSEDNRADIFTKNVIGEINAKHINSIIVNRNEM